MKIKATIFSLIIMTVFFSLSFALVSPAKAQIKSGGTSAMGQLEAGGGSAGFDVANTQEDTILKTVMSFIKIILGLLGTVFIVLIVVGGYWYITSHGMEDKIEKGKNTISAAIIGLLIVLMSYGIVQFISTRMLEATGYGN